MNGELADGELGGEHLVLGAEGLARQHPVRRLLVLLDAVGLEGLGQLTPQELVHGWVRAQLGGVVPWGAGRAHTRAGNNQLKRERRRGGKVAEKGRAAAEEG